MDSSLAEAHTALATVKLAYDRDWDGAESEFKEAVALNPNYATAHHWYSHYLVPMGKLDEAAHELELARDLDPFSQPINEFLGTTLYYAHRYDDSLRQARRASEMRPELSQPHDQAADIYEQQNKLAEAFTERQRASRINGDTAVVAALDEVYQRSGYGGYLRARIDSLERTSKAGAVPNLLLAHLYARSGDRSQVLHHLERAYDEDDPWLVNVRVDPAFEPVRSDPRFRNLMRRLDLPP